MTELQQHLIWKGQLLQMLLGDSNLKKKQRGTNFVETRQLCKRMHERQGVHLVISHNLKLFKAAVDLDQDHGGTWIFFQLFFRPPPLGGG